MTGAEPGIVEIAEPEIQTRTRPSQGDPVHDWLCAWCLNRVASEKGRFSHEGKSEFSFQNPEDIRFHIVTFSRTIGCRQAGVPTLEHNVVPKACVVLLRLRPLSHASGLVLRRPE